MTNPRVVRTRRTLLALVAALALAGPGAAPQEDPTGSWEVKTAGDTFSQGASATDGAHLYVIAGMQVGTVSSFPEMFQQFRRYDPVSNSWTTLDPVPVPVFDAAGAFANGAIYCIGGSDILGGASTGAIQEFSLASMSWTTPTPYALNSPRQAHAAAALDGLIYVTGGYNGIDIIAGGEVFDPASGTSAAIPDMPIAFQYHAMTALSDRIVVTTGYDAMGGPVGDSLSYSPGAPGWVALATLGDPRYGAASFAIEGRVYVAGGFYDDAMASTWEYNPAGNSWARRADLNSPRNFHGAAAIGGKGYVYGGSGVSTGEEFTAPVFAPPPSNHAPAADAGPDQTVDATSADGASVTLDGSGSTDEDGDALTYSWSPVNASGATPTVTLPIGENVLTLTVSDGQTTSTDTVTITVVDTEGPTITNLSASPCVLWSPNHDMRQVVLTATTSDAADGAPECEIISVTCNQASNGDIEITGDMALNLRAERTNGETRIYTITVRCTDSSGNSAEASTTVSVPHNQGNDGDAGAQKAKK